MLEKDMAKIVKKIEMPETMRKRIIENCNAEMEEKRVSRNKVYRFSKKSMAAVAALAICVCVTSVTALAATGKLQGFFKDVLRWDGAVIGTTYEQATEEVELEIIEAADDLVVELFMVNPKNVPYSTFEMFGVERYKIVDMSGKTIAESKEAVMEEIIDGKVVIHIPLTDVEEGEYRLVVREMTGSSKADQPLVLSGNWETAFVK